LGSDVTYRLAPRAVFCLVLLVSLLLKLPGYMDRAAAPANLPPIGVLAFLERHGFQVSEDSSTGELTWLSGTMGACRVLIARVAPDGWHRSLVMQIAAGNQLFYTFGGEVYSEQPVMWTRTYHYWGKLNGYVGLSVPIRPTLAVVASPNCETEPLHKLANRLE
jgi:hypothetical protein